MPVLNEKKPMYCTDMAILVEELLSENIGRTPEGFLICKDVAVARVGTQRYLGREIGADDQWDQMLDVYRLSEDVFSVETIASFEGKPITDGHPPGYFVAPDNFSMLAKGHAQNARRVGDYIVMDLIINDPVLISKVENRVIREVSMGYSCHYAPHGDSFKQIQIRGNHIAIVDKGRAGKKVSIKDEKPKGKKTMKETQAQMLKALAVADADPEVIAEALALIGDTKKETVETRDEKAPSWLGTLIAAIAKPKTVKDEDEEKKDDDDKKEKAEDRLSKMEATLDRLAKVIETKALDESEEELEKTLNEEETKAEDEDSDEDKDDDKKETSDSKALILQLAKDLKPVMAKMSAKDQELMKNAFKKAHGGKAEDQKSAYGEIQKIIKESSKRKIGDAMVDHTQRGKDIAAKYNPAYAHLKVVKEA